MIQTNNGSARRRFLQITAGAAAMGWMPRAVTTLSCPEPVFAQSTFTPEAALAELMAGNQRFADRKMTAHEHDLTILKQSTAEKQEPFAAVLSCADSRVPVELIFDQSIGHIFVTRIAGNVITPEIVASLEYGAMVLGIKVLLVIGHAGCGAVKATSEGKEAPGQISALFPHIQPAIDQAGDSLEAVSKANARIQAALLRESSTVVSALVKEGKVKVAAAYYDIVSGRVNLL